MSNRNPTPSISSNNNLVLINQELVIAHDFTNALADFLRLNIADGDASPHTIRSIYSNLTAFNNWCVDADINPARATEDDIRAFRAYLVETDYSRATIEARLWAIRKLFEAAIWRGLRPDNPARGVKPPKDTTDPADKVKFLSLEGYKSLLSTPDSNTPKGRRDRAILALLGLHGLRVFEVAGLTLSSIDGDTITIIGKGKRERKAILTPQSRTVLDLWLDDRASINPDTESLFISLGNRNYSQPMAVRGIRHMVDSYLTQCGLKEKGISCHSLRHSFATWATYRGAKIEHLQAAMGHSSRETTAIYQGVVDRVKHNPALLLGDLLS